MPSGTQSRKLIVEKKRKTCSGNHAGAKVPEKISATRRIKQESRYGPSLPIEVRHQITAPIAARKYQHHNGVVIIWLSGLINGRVTRYSYELSIGTSQKEDSATASHGD